MVNKSKIFVIYPEFLLTLIAMIVSVNFGKRCSYKNPVEFNLHKHLSGKTKKDLH